MPRDFKDIREIQGEDAITLRFGGGINSRASEDEIDDRECSDGQNFTLDLADRQFVSRRPFDVMGTAPNDAQINGFAFLKKANGDVSMLVQAGTAVYNWDGVDSWVSVGTVASGTRMRGKLEHAFLLDDKVIITDLALAQGVSEWNGTTFQATTFLDGSVETPFGPFRAKYCTVTDERAMFANIYDDGTLLPHLIVGSQRSNFEVISVANRPSSSLSAADPFFLIAPDLRPINGMVDAFSTTLFSTEGGELFVLAGESATDFSINPFFPRSFASGDESIVNIGNDVLYGRPGRIESVADTDRFGDSEVNDRSIKISNQIANFTDWTLVYNQRLQRVYCFSEDRSDLWVYFKPVAEATEFSPWSKWRTSHPLAFQPTCVMNGLDPVDGLEYVFMGDSLGNVYRLEGTGLNGDSGEVGIASSRTSKLYSAPLDAHVYNFHGYLKYRRGLGNTAALTFLFSGESVTNQSIEVPIVERSPECVYGDCYYGSAYYGSAFDGRLVRERFGVAGKSNELQIKIAIDGPNRFTVNEVGVRFETSA